MRKRQWKKILSAVVAASMVFSLVPVSAGAASAQTKAKTVSEPRGAQSIEDVLDQGNDVSGYFGTGFTAKYFTDAIDGVVEAGTLYVQGAGTSSWILDVKGTSWDNTYPDWPIKVLHIKDAEISRNTWNGKSALTKVILEGVTTIQDSAFSGCKSLEQIDLGTSLTTLGGSVFSGDISLTHIRIPAGVTKLTNGLFNGCTGLRDVAICTTEAQPEQGSDTALTFLKSKSLVYAESGRDGIGHPFNGCSDMTIYVAARGNGMETAMDFLYKECAADGGTFAGNADLTSVTYTVSTLDQYEAKTVATGELAVSCPDVIVGGVPAPAITKNETGISADGVKWLYFNKDKRPVSVEEATSKMGTSYVKAVLQDSTHFSCQSDFVPFQVQMPLDYTVEDGVLKITLKPGIKTAGIPDFSSPSSPDNTAPWKDEKFSRIELADGITSIGAYAFSGTGLEVADLSGTKVTTIGEQAFAKCQQLVRVSLPETLETLEGDSYAYTFAYCSSLRYLEGLEQTKLTKIPGYAFRECSSLNNIQIPASVEEVGGNAFLKCTDLVNVIYDAGEGGMASLARSAFMNCTALENILLRGQMIGISASALSGCSALKKVTIKGLEGDDAFLDIVATAFKGVEATIYVPNADTQSTVRSTLASNAFYADDADKAEEEQKIRVIKDGDDSNIAAKKLSFLNISLEKDALDPGQEFAPAVVEKIGDGAVTYWYYKLVDGAYVLADEENPAKVPVQPGAYFIEGRMAATDTYYACKSNKVLCTVNGAISDDAFDFNSKTGVLLIKKDMANMDALKAVFTNCQSLIKEVSWAEPEQAYTAVPSFEGCTELIKAENIPCGANFKGCVSLGKALFRDDFSSQSIGSFTGCVSLTSIDIPSSVETIADYAFQDCSKLQEVNFLRSHDDTSPLDHIGCWAFQNCTALKQIVLPKGTVGDGYAHRTTISGSAFEGCSALETVEFEMQCTIASNAFRDCVKLCSVKIAQKGDSGLNSELREKVFENAGTEADSLVVTLPDDCSIGKDVFADSGITDIILGDLTEDYNRLPEYALAGAKRLKSVIIKGTNYTSTKAPGIVNQNFTARCGEDLVIYATGDTLDLLVENGYTNAKDYATVVEAKKTAFAATEEVYKGLDASLYDKDLLQEFLEETLVLGKEMVEEAIGADSTANIFEQADIIDQVEALLAQAYFEGGLATAPTEAVAALTKDLVEEEYTAESWKALTDAQAAVTAFLAAEKEYTTSAQVSEFEGLVKAAKAVKLVKKTEVKNTPEPGKNTPEPGKNTPEPGKNTPEPGKNTPEPGKNTPEPGKNTPEPGKNTPEPGKNTPEPGGNTPTPGGNTPTPGGNTPAPGQNNQTPGQNNQTPGQNIKAPQQAKTLAAVKLAKVKAKKKAAVVKWKKLAGANGYQLSYSLKKNFKGAKAVTVKGKKTSYTIKKLKKGKTYYIRIRAYRTVSGKKQYGKWSKAKKVKIKKK